MALTRSENMKRIRSRNTEPELILRKQLWAAGVRYRTDFRTPGGRADIALSARRFAVFVDGCFWHGCPEHYVRPRSSKDFWDRKLLENVERDAKQMRRLLAEEWVVVRLWEHELREAPASAAEKVLAALQQRRGSWPEWRTERVEFLSADGSLERRFLRSLLGEERRVEEAARQTAKQGRVARASVEKAGDD